jgi:hypothetical protein
VAAVEGAAVTEDQKAMCEQLIRAEYAALRSHKPYLTTEQFLRRIEGTPWIVAKPGKALVVNGQK